MSKHLSAREQVNAVLGKKLSPQGQEVIDSLKHLSDPGEEEGAEEEPAEEEAAGRTEVTEKTKESDDAADANPNADSPQPTANPAGNSGDSSDVIHSAPREGSPLHRKAQLLQLIDSKLTETQSTNPPRTTPAPSTRGEINRANAQKSTGPRTPEGKARVSANALKTGFYANVEKLNPHDSPAYLSSLDDLRQGLHPDGPVEEVLIRELAMFRARLSRLEATEYALLCADIETNPGDTREIAAAMLNNTAALDRLSKAETHLRRAYNRTWDRLERMQKERKKLPFQEALKQTHLNATYEAIRTTCPKCSGPDDWKKRVPPLHPALNENGDLKAGPGDPETSKKRDVE